MNEHLQELKCGGRPMTKLELLQKENEELKERINKAIEILNGMKHIDKLLEGYSRISNIDKVINILKGENENER